jgi:hypothetical protein
MRHSVFAVMMLALMTAVASAQSAKPGDRWWDVINTNGQVIWLDTDRIWRSGGRTFALIRLAPVVSGHSDYTTAQDLIAATDCNNLFADFKTDQDYEHLPLGSVSGMGMALIGAICKTTH